MAQPAAARPSAAVPAITAARRPRAEPALDESFDDLAHDFEELSFVAGCTRAGLERTLAELQAADGSLRAGTARFVTGQALHALTLQAGTDRRLRALRARAASGPRSPGTLARLTHARHGEVELLRAQHAIAAAVATAADWQSPSFGHSLQGQAGLQAGLITEHVDDYKRDRHHDALAWEQAYLAELVDGAAERDARALLTSCGMSAFATVLDHLAGDGRLGRRPVLAGRGLYHEARELLHRALPGRVVELDEHDTGAFAAALARLRPAAVFLDTLCNTSRAQIPDLPAIAALLRADHGAGEVHLVLDNTGLSAAFQPCTLLPAGESRVRLIVFESLLKYSQHGLDRVTAGVIVAAGTDAERLSARREHLGTNIADFAARALLAPNRPLLLVRLARLERNATLLARRLGERIRQAGDGVFAHAVHPSLATHGAHARARALPFRGSCLAIELEPGEDVVRRGRELIAAALGEARRRHVPLIAGSSFGFDIARIYLTAGSVERGEPFIRIAAGTEHRLGAERLADVLATAMDRVAGR